jgi:hypothetical protein
MKKILFLIISSLFLIQVLGSKNVYAQVKEQLAITSFSDDLQMDLIFAQSLRVLVYTEGGANEPAKVLSLITPHQKEELISGGLKPVIIDENPDILRYVLLYNPLPDQSDALRPYGEIIPVSRYYTLLKIPANTDFIHEGPAAKFFRIPFVEEVKRPPKNIVVTPQISAESEKSQENTQKANDNWVITGGVVTIIVLIGGILLLLRWIKKKRNKDQQPQF